MAQTFISKIEWLAALKCRARGLFTTMLETLDYTTRIGSTPTLFFDLCLYTLPTQHTTFMPCIFVYSLLLIDG